MDINQLTGKLDNIKALAAFAKCYENYSYDYDCRSDAKRFDDMVSDYARLKMDAKTARDLELYSRQVSVPEDVMKYVTKYDVLENLFDKARAMLADIAAKEESQRCASAADWDRRISALLGQELSVARCDKVKQLYSEFAKVPSDVKAKCKEAGRLTEAVSRDDIYRAAALFDEKVASLAKTQITTAERAKEVIAFSKENLGKKDMLRYVTRLSTLSDMCNKAQAVLTDIAAKAEAEKCANAADWDRRIETLLCQELSLSWCEQVEKLYASFNKAPAEIRARCKEGTSLKSAYCMLDVYLSAAMLDKSIEDLTKKTWCEELCLKVESVDKQFNGSSKAVREACTKSKLLSDLKDQVIKYRSGEAKKLDDEYRRVILLSRSSTNISVQREFISTWKKTSEKIKSYCKVATAATIEKLISQGNSEEEYLKFEERIDDLTTLIKSGLSKGLAWCDSVDDLWSKVFSCNLSACRNFSKLEAAKEEADRIRLQDECREYTDALSGEVDFELVFKLDKSLSKHINSLLKLNPNFKTVWNKRLSEAKAQSVRQAKKWCEEALDCSDDTKKLSLLKKSVELGNITAVRELGKYYHFKAREESSKAKASKLDKESVSLFIQASDQGDKEASFFLGYSYYCGNGCTKDYNKAFKYLKDSADNHVEEYHNLGLCYSMVGDCYSCGFGTSKDSKKAFEYYGKGAKQGHASSMYLYGKRFEEGSVTAKNEEEALRWYELAEKKGNSDAKKAAERLRAVIAERKRKEEEARRRQELNNKIDVCYENATKGDVFAQYELGEYYFTGNGVTRSYDDAFIWFEKAAKRGHKKAMERLGDCYYNGYGVRQNYSKAEKWYKKASK